MANNSSSCSGKGWGQKGGLRQVNVSNPTIENLKILDQFNNQYSNCDGWQTQSGLCWITNSGLVWSFDI